MSSKTFKKVQVGKDQEKAQSEKDSHSKNRGGKKPVHSTVSACTALNISTHHWHEKKQKTKKKKKKKH